MRARYTSIVLTSLILFAGTRATAVQCSLIIPAVLTGTPPVCLMICPYGDGDSLAQAWLRGSPAVQVDATISAVLMDDNGNPISNFPFEDAWLHIDGLCTCDPDRTLLADADSDANGVFTFSGSLLGGGCATDPTVELVINGTVCATSSTPLNLHITSVDFDCDGAVNPTGPTGTDRFAMAVLYFNHDDCADLNHDGMWTPADAAILAQHTYFGVPPIHECP